MEAVTYRKAKPHMARLMAHDSLKRGFFAGAYHCFITAIRVVIPASKSVIPAFKSVIPAKAGIQPQFKQRTTSRTVLDTRLRGYDGIQWADSVEAGRGGV